MSTTVRGLMAVQIAVFAIASLIHQGYLLDGYADGAAATAEGIIAIALLIGLAIGWFVPWRARLMALLAQAFALAGTSIGVFLVIRGVGPNTPLDIGIHALMVVLLIVGLWLAWTDRGEDRTALAA